MKIQEKLPCRLAAQAVSHGIALQQYASKLLEEAAAARPAAGSKLTRESLHALLDRIGEGAENRPKLPTSAFTRESFYEERR